MPRRNLKTVFYDACETTLKYTVWQCRKTHRHPEGAYLPEVDVFLAEEPQQAWVNEMRARGHRVLCFEETLHGLEFYDEGGELEAFRIAASQGGKPVFDVKQIRAFLQSNAGKRKTTAG